MRITDAYAHVGEPRFGSLEQMIRYMQASRIGRAVAVLGPLVPDLTTLAAAARLDPDRLRVVGIPFGDTAAKRLEAVRVQLALGAIGMRLDLREASDNPDVMALLGERGRIAYGIDACRNQQIAGMYLAWLDRYPAARVIAPHFMAAGFDRSDEERAGGNVERLMRHPRFAGILVRNLGMLGSQPPHAEYRAWIDYVLEHCGASRLMWGSEYPVLYWRNELPEAAIATFRGLLASASDEQFARIADGNAADLLFGESPPERETLPTMPDWIDRDFPRNRNVPLLPKGIELQPDVYSRLLESYMASPAYVQGLSLADYLLAPWMGRDGGEQPHK